MEPEAKKRKGESEGEKEKGGPEHHLQPPPLVTQESIGLGRLPSFDLENLGVLDPAPGGAGGIGGHEGNPQASGSFTIGGLNSGSGVTTDSPAGSNLGMGSVPHIGCQISGMSVPEAGNLLKAIPSMPSQTNIGSQAMLKHVHFEVADLDPTPAEHDLFFDAAMAQRGGDAHGDATGDEVATPAAMNGTLPDPGTSLRTAMAAVAAASPQTAGMFKEKASSYRGITRRKRRWEAHVWRHGRQTYLGGYRDEVEAARAYDMAVLKIRGKEADTNFPRDNYLEELREMRASEMSVEDFIVSMRDRAKRRSKALKEEEEERRAKVLAGLVKRQANASASAANGNGLLLAKLYSLPSGPLLKSIPSHDLHQMVQAVGQLKQQQTGGRRGGEGGSVQGAGQASGREELTSAKTQGSETTNNNSNSKSDYEYGSMPPTPTTPLGPKDVQALVRWGGALLELAHLKQGHESIVCIEEAVERIEQALKIDPRKHEALWCLGNAYTRQGFLHASVEKAQDFFDRASDCFRKACKEDPNNEVYKKALEMNSKAPQLHAQIQKQLQQQQEASMQEQAKLQSASSGTPGGSPVLGGHGQYGGMASAEPSPRGGDDATNNPSNDLFQANEDVFVEALNTTKTNNVFLKDYFLSDERAGDIVYFPQDRLPWFDRGRSISDKQERCICSLRPMLMLPGASGGWKFEEAAGPTCGAVRNTSAAKKELKNYMYTGFCKDHVQGVGLGSREHYEKTGGKSVRGFNLERKHNNRSRRMRHLLCLQTQQGLVFLKWCTQCHLWKNFAGFTERQGKDLAVHTFCQVCHQRQVLIKEKAKAQLQEERQRAQARQTSPYRGVCFNKSDGKFHAYVFNKGKHYLGCFEDDEMAAKACDKAKLKLFGKDADLNFPDQDYAVPGSDTSAEDYISDEVLTRLLRQLYKSQSYKYR